MLPAGRTRRASSPSASPPSPTPPTTPVLPSSGGRGSGSVSPGRPVSSAGGRTKGGWQAVKWLPVGQSLPPASSPGERFSSPAALPELRSSSRLWAPPPWQSCWWVTAFPSLCPGASGKVLRGDLLLTDPPQRHSSAACGSGSLISLFFFFLLLLLSPFGLYSPSSLCRQLLPPLPPPQQAAEIKHLRAVMPFLLLNAVPVRGQSGAWLSGNLRNL